MKQEYSASAISCHWCGTPLGNASRIIYLNGNLPVCDMCLIKQGYFVTFAPIDGTEKEDGDVGVIVSAIMGIALWELILWLWHHLAWV